MEAENSVSAQEQTAVPLKGGEEITKAGRYTMSGPYTRGIKIDVTGDVTIDITDNTTYTSDNADAFLEIVKASNVVIENKQDKTVQCMTNNSILDVESDTNVKLEGGEYLSFVSEKKAVLLFKAGSAHLNNVTVASQNGTAIENNGADVTLEKGNYSSNSYKNYSAVRNEAGTLTINNATITAEAAAVYNARDCMVTFNSGEYSGSRSYPALSNWGKAYIHGGTFESPRSAILSSGQELYVDEDALVRSGGGSSDYSAGIRCSSGKTVIDGVKIYYEDYGIWVEDGDVTLGKAEFDNQNDIYLSAGKTITISDKFDSTAKVKVEERPVAIPRQITTTKTTGQDKLKLISNDGYFVAWKKNEDNTEYRYLTQKTGYTVELENATATTGEGDSTTSLDKFTQIASGTKVSLTAQNPGGKKFTGWKVEKADGTPVNGLLDAETENTENTSFFMPKDDLIITAGYEEATVGPDIPADGGAAGGPADNIGGAISAVVVGAAAGAIIYEAGTGIYRAINMPGIAMPSDRIELAELLWERADKPEPVSTALYSDIDESDTDAQKAARWAVEQELMKDNGEKNTFNPHFPVSKLRICLTWNAAKEKGLFDTDKTAE